MPATCLQSIISLREICDEPTESLSGFDLFDLPGMSLTQAADIADAEYVTGKALLIDKRRIALMKIKNDLIGVLQSNDYIPQTVANIFRTGTLRRDRDAYIVQPLNNDSWRGNVIYANRADCALRKLYITEVYIKSDYDGPTTLRITDDTNVYDYDITLTAGAINAITVNFKAEGKTVELLLPDTIAVYSVNPNCGCGGQANECARILGTFGAATTNTEGFGIWADVQCACDYDHLLCQLGRQGLLGEILMYKTGIEIMDERLKTDRLNYFTTYGREEAKETKAEWYREYVDKWNILINSLPGVLPTVDRCGCIECGGMSIRTNI